ncbi:MAG: adenylyl-sulfate kinase [Planctomycetota bacterium]
MSDFIDHTGDALGESPGLTVWLTGLSGSGKTTLARLAEDALRSRGFRVQRLDGDVLREGLNADLGFSPEHRTENVRRVGEVAALFARAGLITFASVISPYAKDRLAARRAHDRLGVRFLEAFVDAPLDEVERRDVKGLYAKARAGEIPEFTGISAPYEPPASPDVHLKTAELFETDAAQQLVERVLAEALSPATEAV